MGQRLFKRNAGGSSNRLRHLWYLATYGGYHQLLKTLMLRMVEEEDLTKVD